MDALFDILRYSIGSVIWGILIALCSMALFVFLIKGWYKDAVFSPVSYAIGFIVFLFLSFQCILIMGSLKIISMTDDYEQQIASLVEIYAPESEVSQAQASDIIDHIINEYPILEYYIGGGEFMGYTSKELPSAIAMELRSFMRWYIFRRIMWCLVFVVLGAVLVIKSISNNYASTRRKRIQSDRRRVGRRTRR